YCFHEAPSHLAPLISLFEIDPYTSREIPQRRPASCWHLRLPCFEHQDERLRRTCASYLATSRKLPTLKQVLIHRSLNSPASYARLKKARFTNHSISPRGDQMASRWDELMAEYEYLDAQETQVRFITDRTGFSAGDVSRVLVHLTPDAFGEEWDPEAQAR